MEKLPIKTIKYEQNEYDLAYKLVFINKKTKKATEYVKNKSVRRKLFKELYNIQKYKKLTNTLIQKRDNFTRFIKKRNKKILDTEKYEVYLYYLKISKGFLSYIIQDKNKIEDLFTEIKCVKKLKYYIPNYNNVFKYEITRNGATKKRTIKDGLYKKILVTNSKHIKQHKNIEVKQSRLYINGKKLIRYNNQEYGMSWLYEKVLITTNHYEEFKTLLEDFFKIVCTSNKSWKEVIKSDVNKMMKYLTETSLKEMQQEYEQIKENKIKQYQKWLVT